MNLRRRADGILRTYADISAFVRDQAGRLASGEAWLRVLSVLVGVMDGKNTISCGQRGVKCDRWAGDIAQYLCKRRAL